MVKLVQLGESKTTYTKITERFLLPMRIKKFDNIYIIRVETQIEDFIAAVTVGVNMNEGPQFTIIIIRKSWCTANSINKCSEIH